ncbi:MAG: tRNA pseudouridine(13) synthase TruD [Candidatus Bathyarchaeia archaeon]
MRVSRLEKSIGIEVYATSSPGIGGVIRQPCEDFVVEELLVNGSKAEVFAPHMPLLTQKWPLTGRYLLCVLIKQNWDTFQVLEAIAKQLGISSQKIHIAGIKDAKAVTAQHITIRDVKPEDVKNVNIERVKIVTVGFFQTKLSPYYLLGNSFKIVIRAISHTKSTIQQRIEKIVKEIEALGGIPNFFGHQRFGTIRPITHLVGKAIVKGDFHRAAMLFLAKPYPFEHPESRIAREELYRTQDFKKALKSFPRHLYYERLMLEHLAKKPEDFKGAFRKLPVKLRKLIPQAYQAYLFNRFLSKRIALGLPINAAEVGDYVVKIETTGLPSQKLYEIASQMKIPEINSAIASGKMRLAIPLVGFRQRLTEGVQGEIEKQILKEEGIAPENFKIKGMPELSLKGGLRTALTTLKDFRVDEISRDHANPRRNMAKISFTLHRGSYATAFLRELMKPRNPVKAGF